VELVACTLGGWGWRMPRP